MADSGLKQHPNPAWLSQPRISRPDLGQRPLSLNNTSKQALRILKKIKISKVVIFIRYLRKEIFKI